MNVKRKYAVFFLFLLHLTAIAQKQPSVQFFEEKQQYALVNSKGRAVSGYYTAVFDFEHSHAIVQKGVLFGIINQSGKEIVPVRYSAKEIKDQLAKRLRKKLGDKGEFWLYLAEKHRRDEGRVKEYCRKGYESDSTDIERILSIAELVRRVDNDKGLSYYEKAYMLDSTNKELVLRIADIVGNEEKEGNDAFLYYRKAYRLDSTNLEHILQLADKVKKKEEGEFLFYCRKAYERDSTNAGTVLRIAEKLTKEKMLKSLFYYKKSYERDSSNFEHVLKIADAVQKLWFQYEYSGGEVIDKEAYFYYRRAYELDSSTVEHLIEIINGIMINRERANAYYRQAYRVDSNNVDHVLKIADYDFNDWDNIDCGLECQKGEYLEEIYKKDSTDVRVLLKLIEAKYFWALEKVYKLDSLNASQIVQALDASKHCEELNEESEDPVTGEIRSENGDLFIEYARKAYELDSGNAEHVRKIAACFNSRTINVTGRSRELLERYVKKAYELDSTNHQNLLGIAEVLKPVNEQRAIDWAEKAYRIDSTDVSVLLWLGDALWDESQALLYYKKANQLYHDTAKLRDKSEFINDMLDFEDPVTGELFRIDYLGNNLTYAWSYKSIRAGCFMNSRERVFGSFEESIRCFTEDAYFRKDDKGKWGVMDVKGKVLVDYKYDKVIEVLKEGKAKVMEGKQAFWINKKGERLAGI